MSWVQENKFTAAIVGISVVASGALFYLGVDARSVATKVRSESNSAIQNVNSLKLKKPYPSASNRKLVDDNVAIFTEEALSLQSSLLAFRPETLPKLSQSAFQAKIGQYRKVLTDYFKEKGVSLPETGVGFGMEDYIGGKMANEKSTRYLEYQRKSLEWMFKKLADAEPQSLDNVYRKNILEESGKSLEDAALSKNNTRGRRKSKNIKVKKNDSVHRVLPIEIAFTGSEQTLKKFMQELANSQEYFFITKSIRLANLDPESPDLEEGRFKEAPPALEGFGGDDFLDANEQADEPIIKQVTGEEKIKVHLSIDLVLFKEAGKVTFPGANQFAKSQTAVDKAPK